VTDNGSDTLSVIDLGGDRVERVAVDVDPSRREAPHHLAVDAASGQVFVALAFPPEKTASKDPHASHGNASDHGALARLDLDTLTVRDTHEVDENPGDVVLTHDRSRVLVTHFDMKRAMTAAAAGGAPSALFATLQVWDRATMTKVASRAVCVAPHGVVTTADDRTALVACYGSDELDLVDLTGTQLGTARYPLGPGQGVLGAPRYGPYSVALSADGARAVVCDLEGQDLRVFDVPGRRFIADRVVTLGARVFMAEFVAPRAVLAPLQSPDGLARIDVESGDVVKRVSYTKNECQAPHVARRAQDGRVFVVCEGDHAAPGAVIEVDPETLATRRRWTVGVYPDGIAFGNE